MKERVIPKGCPFFYYKVPIGTTSKRAILFCGECYLYLGVLVAELMQVGFHEVVDVGVAGCYFHVSLKFSGVQLHLAIEDGIVLYNPGGVLKKQLALAGEGDFSFLSGKKGGVV